MRKNARNGGPRNFIVQNGALDVRVDLAYHMGKRCSRVFHSLNTTVQHDLLKRRLAGFWGWLAKEYDVHHADSVQGYVVAQLRQSKAEDYYMKFRNPGIAKPYNISPQALLDLRYRLMR